MLVDCCLFCNQYNLCGMFYFQYLLLQSPEACLKDVDSFSNNSVGNGLSSGAIFFIVLIVLWCSYILVGAVANHFLRGATGWEMIPNYQFWKNVPNAFMVCIQFFLFKFFHLCKMMCFTKCDLFWFVCRMALNLLPMAVNHHRVMSRSNELTWYDVIFLLKIVVSFLSW